MGYYSVKKKDEILSFVTTWMELKTIVLSEINQEPHDLNSIWNRKKMLISQKLKIGR
jgi:hypothetical protein